MESINVEFVQNLLASYKEFQESYYALQNRMAAFEAMASAKFEDYEAKLAEKDMVIASLKSEVADLTKKLERYREKDKTNSSNSHMSPSSDKTKLRDSRFYFCVMARSVSENMNRGIGTDDYFDLSSIENVRVENNKMSFFEYTMGYSTKGYLDMCNHCHGADRINWPIPAAEQM